MIDLYTAYSDAMVRETLANLALAPLARLRAYFDAQIAMMKRDGEQTRLALEKAKGDAEKQVLAEPTILSILIL